jgi:hypothetical protein
MPNVQFSQADIANLKQEVSSKGAPGFCNDWPTARTVLESLLAMIPNPLAKAAIGIVVAAGDALCGNTASSST